MDNQVQVPDVPYIVHEGDMARMERTVKRLWIALLMLIALLVASNLGWLAYESQFETVTTKTEQAVVQDAENGNNTFVGGDAYGTATD